jgi:glycosyl-4,4'-diaponeurosporenoate acyltransferase
MQIIFLPKAWTIALCFAVWLVLQASPALICLYLPDRFLTPERFLFRSHRFERNGRIYDQLFRVSRWKHLLPDGGTVWKKRGFQKKKLSDLSEETLKRFLIESSRGELSHWIAISPFWVFWFFTPAYVPWIMLVYAILINMPCILAQRYNRPRVQHLLERKRATVKVHTGC